MADKRSLSLIGYLYAGITAAVLIIAALGVGADLMAKSDGAARAHAAPASTPAR